MRLASCVTRWGQCSGGEDDHTQHPDDGTDDADAEHTDADLHADDGADNDAAAKHSDAEYADDGTDDADDEYADDGTDDEYADDGTDDDEHADHTNTQCRTSLVDKQFGSKADRIYCGPCYDSQFATRCDGCGDVFKAGEVTWLAPGSSPGPQA